MTLWIAKSGFFYFILLSLSLSHSLSFTRFLYAFIGIRNSQIFIASSCVRDVVMWPRLRMFLRLVSILYKFFRHAVTFVGDFQYRIKVGKTAYTVKDEEFFENAIHLLGLVVRQKGESDNSHVKFLLVVVIVACDIYLPGHKTEMMAWNCNHAYCINENNWMSHIDEEDIVDAIA